MIASKTTAGGCPSNTAVGGWKAADAADNLAVERSRAGGGWGEGVRYLAENEEDVPIVAPCLSACCRPRPGGVVEGCEDIEWEGASAVLEIVQIGRRVVFHENR